MFGLRKKNDLRATIEKLEERVHALEKKRILIVDYGSKCWSTCLDYTYQTGYRVPIEEAVAKLMTDAGYRYQPGTSGYIKTPDKPVDCAQPT